MERGMSTRTGGGREGKEEAEKVKKTGELLFVNFYTEKLLDNLDIDKLLHN